MGKKKQVAATAIDINDLGCLRTIAEAMNKVMNLEPPMDTTIEDVGLLRGYIQANAAIRQEGDVFEPQISEAIDAIAASGPTAEPPAGEEPSAAGSSAGGTEDNLKDGKKETAMKKSAPKAAAPKGKAAKKPAAERKPGVIATMIDMLKAKPMTIDDCAAALAKKFPDRKEDSIKATLRVQLPGRVQKEKGVKVTRDDKGRYSIK